MVNLRQLDPPEWCGSKPQRLRDRNWCESAYIVYYGGTDGVTPVFSLCAFNEKTNPTCKADLRVEVPC